MWSCFSIIPTLTDHKALKGVNGPVQEQIVEMTGQTSPDARAKLWETPSKRLYFMTPGTLKNDIRKGSECMILYMRI